MPDAGARLGSMTDDISEDETVTESDTETEEDDSVSRRRIRKQELETELKSLDEEPVDADASEVTDAVDDEAEAIAAGPAETTQEVKVEADQAADEIATAAQRQGVTFTDAEIDGIARRIVKRTKEIEAEEGQGSAGKNESDKPKGKVSQERTRTPDRRPRGTHFSERRMFGKGKD